MQDRPTMTIHYGPRLTVENNNLTDRDVDIIRTKLDYVLPGWNYDTLTGTFTGPARDDAYPCIQAILTERFGPDQAPGKPENCHICHHPIAGHIEAKPCVTSEPRTVRGWYDLPIAKKMWREDGHDLQA